MGGREDLSILSLAFHTQLPSFFFLSPFSTVHIVTPTLLFFVNYLSLLLGEGGSGIIEFSNLPTNQRLSHVLEELIFSKKKKS